MKFLIRIFALATTRVFDNIDNWNSGFLPLSKFGEDFHSEELTGHLRKVDPNESVGLDHFVFVIWCLYEEVYLESAEEAEFLVVWVYKASLMDLQ